MRQEKPHLFFIHLLRFLAFSDFSASRRHHSVSASYFGEGIVTTKRETGNKFNGEKKRGILVFREEEDIAPIIQFIGSNRLAFEKV